MSGIFLVAAKRTPFGAFGGSLATTSATELGVVASKAALADTNLDPHAIDSCFFGNVIQSSADAAYLARHVALQTGLPLTTPSLTINRLCGSGFETVVLGSQSIQLGESQIALCGGAENMSAAPLQVGGNDCRFKGVALGQGLHLRDALWDGLTDSLYNAPMGVTAENLAKQYQITREQCDEYAVASQQKWAQANAKGVFAAETAPVEITNKKTTTTIDTDEHPRPETTLEQLAKLRPVFDPNGVVTAATSSGICDGAGAILVASEAAVKQHNLQPLARIVSSASVGCEPTIMGIGPVPAMKQALQKANLSFQDMDRIEINEAFAAQVLACAKELDLDRTKLNIHGGAIAMGHPLGASGSRLLAHLAHAFAQEPQNRYHMASSCIGGGQGIAVLLEKV